MAHETQLGFGAADNDVFGDDKGINYSAKEHDLPKKRQANIDVENGP